MLVMFKLKDNVKAEDYERWAKDVNAPASRSLSSVDDWRLHRVDGLVGSSEKPPFDYVEMVQFNDLEKLFEDVSSEKMQKVAAELDTYTHGRVMLLSENIE